MKDWLKKSLWAKVFALAIIGGVLALVGKKLKKFSR